MIVDKWCLGVDWPDSLDAPDFGEWLRLVVGSLPTVSTTHGVEWRFDTKQEMDEAHERIEVLLRLLERLDDHAAAMRRAHREVHIETEMRGIVQ